ncbi:hypothetical protein ACFLTW_04555 [Chloroflexota bacterium]
MKKPLLAFAIIILLVVSFAGCTVKEPVSPPPDEGEVTVSTCITCHTDKNTLKETASAETVAEKSEATSGEG